MFKLYGKFVGIFFNGCVNVGLVDALTVSFYQSFFIGPIKYFIFLSVDHLSEQVFRRNLVKAMKTLMLCQVTLLKRL